MRTEGNTVLITGGAKSNTEAVMTKTTRWYHNIGISYNPYWFMHELKEIRKMLHRRYRHYNRIAIRKFIDIEIEPRTRGWETY